MNNVCIEKDYLGPYGYRITYILPDVHKVCVCIEQMQNKVMGLKICRYSNEVGGGGGGGGTKKRSASKPPSAAVLVIY